MKNRGEWARQSPDIELKFLWHALLRNKEMRKVFGFTFSSVQNDMSHAHLELYLLLIMMSMQPDETNDKKIRPFWTRRQYKGGC